MHCARAHTLRRRPPHRWQLALLLAIGALLTACGVSTTSASRATPTGQLEGTVVAGPTCPVERPDQPCPPRVVPGRTVRIETPQGSVIATTTTDAQGHFAFSLAPGSYLVRVEIVPGSVGMRQQTPGDVMVSAGSVTTIQIVLDTGIR